MNTNERLLRLMELRGITKRKDFAAYLGIKENTLSNWFARGSYNVSVVADKFTDVKKMWLLTGEGEMLVGQEPKPASGIEVQTLLVTIKEQAEEIGRLKARIEELEGKGAIEVTA